MTASELLSQILPTISDFIRANLLASYGAAVGTIALALNFMRYRHAVSSSKTLLKLEIVTDESEDKFEEKMNSSEEKNLFGGRAEYSITHKVKVRNIGGVAAHIQDVWVETQIGKKSATTMDGMHHVHIEVSKIGNIEIPPRSSRSFSVFSYKESGYLKIKRAYAVDETGKKWRS